VQETIQIEGVPLHIIDTAGLRASDDAVEKIGIERAWQAIETADAVLFLHDLTRCTTVDYIAADADISQTLAEKLPTSIPVLHIWNKLDAATAAPGREGIALSAKTGAGLDALRQQLLAAAGWQPAQSGTFIARQRHVQALRSVGLHLESASELLASGSAALDLLAEELRLGQNALNTITGEFGSDDLLGVIFSKFCIGK
jgi:tRNA modification GTPase